eukprot:CAMPEP_0115828654 /NCGR_PEP_ID=MMETSP0287-20121206/686_1 /TAXON_ID=412157 /ORGANISM="Chrysochromulina rotalis, Strain UIO044" /LENGTH=146 /DNA_ID=CAMNT_0003281879 /DNA_START=224 /DNA_END=661 /DNA_ORIENTATION=+
MSVYNGGTYNLMVADCNDDALAARFKVSAVRDFADRKALQMADVIDHLQKKEAGVVLPAEVLVALLAPPSSQASPPVAQGQPAAAPRAADIADPKADAAAIPASVNREAISAASRELLRPYGARETTAEIVSLREAIEPIKEPESA